MWVQDGRLQIAPEEPFATAYLKFPAVVQQVRFLAITGRAGRESRPQGPFPYSNCGDFVFFSSVSSMAFPGTVIWDRREPSTMIFTSHPRARPPLENQWVGFGG